MSEQATGVPADVQQRWRTLIREVPDYPQPGIAFQDITPLLGDAEGWRDVVEQFAAPWAGQVDAVAGIEARGFILAAPVAYALGVGLVPIRKAGKLPWTTLRTEYDLEYGSASIEVHTDAFRPGARVLLVDDVLATGGTAAAAVELVRRAGATLTAVSVLLELPELAGRSRLPGVDVRVLLDAAGRT